VLVIGGVLIPSIVFLFLGYDAARAVTSQTKGQVANVMIGFLTVDGVLLGLSTRFRGGLRGGCGGASASGHVGSVAGVRSYHLPSLVARDLVVCEFL
jgi:hypothetical protein